MDEQTLFDKQLFYLFTNVSLNLPYQITRDPREYNNVLLKDKKLLAKILLQHIVPRKLALTDLRHGDRVLTLAGNRIEFSEFGGLKVADSKIIMSLSDRNVGKGIVHFIGNVIYPFVPITDSTSEEPQINNERPNQTRPNK